jgi:glycosyltransferase involved in cell wall biosynthesis
MAKHDVTVLLPVYNAAPYIREAVDSVLAQTYKDFELLIINDGSTDGSKEILESYNDSRIRLIHQPNMGLIKTLNKGLELAQGKYIARFDADDVCYPERLQEQVDFLNTHPDYVLIGSEADYMDDEGNFLFRYKFKYYEDEEIRAAGFVICPAIHSAVMFLKEKVILAGGYDDHAVTFEDHLLWRDLAEYGKIKNVHKAWIKVRFNAGSATVDEKWRGPVFRDIKYRSIAQGHITEEDSVKLKELLAKQNFKKFKDAAYYSMIGKKYLWNRHEPKRARENIVKSIKLMPTKPEPYLLYVLSFFPEKLITAIYNKKKG